MITLVCHNCSKPFSVRDLEINRRKHCSNRCRYVADAKARIDNFWCLVDRSHLSGCWPWRGTLHDNGYGYIGIMNRRYLAHRLAWEVAFGPFDMRLDVLHHCDNPSCCNPQHLFLGTHADNMRDRQQKGRYRTMPRGEKHHHAKATNAQAKEIKKLKGQFTSREIANHLGVSRHIVKDIWKGKTWRHITIN